METIISPVDVDLIKKELTPNRFVRTTNAGNNSIYIINAHNAPNTMLEIGRLREYTFRSAGGGTGKSADIDDFDTAETPFQQLLVWNNDTDEIISAYRFILGKDAPTDKNGYPITPTSKLFTYSEDFIKDQWKETIELGRSFVIPKYQATKDIRSSFYALDNVWDGLGALTVYYPEIRYFMGKMTLYKGYNVTARTLILEFLSKHFQGDNRLIYPHEIDADLNTYNDIKTNFSLNSEASINEDFRDLNKKIRDLNENIPPLIKTYISLSPTLQYYGVACNKEFGYVEELCIIINIDDIYLSKKSRHIDSFKMNYKK